jgi:hypothetical protein
MVSIKMTTFHPMNLDLKSKGRMRERALSFLCMKADVFVTDIGCKARNFHVQPSYLFFCTFKLEGLVNFKVSSRCCPRFSLNILMGIVEEIKIGEEGILDNLIPVEYLLGWY